jgi:hypothetical protein
MLDGSTPYGIDVETSWIKAHDLQGFGKLGAIVVLGEYRSACMVRIRLARDYQCNTAGHPTYFDDRAWRPMPAAIAGPMQVRHVPSAGNSNVESIKVRITAVEELARAALTTVDLRGPSNVDFALTWIWDSQWAVSDAHPGEMGNAITMSLAFQTDDTLPSGLPEGLPYTVDVRDHFTYEPATLLAIGRWRERVNNVGVFVTARSDVNAPSVASLQAAIAAATSLLAMIAGDPLEELAVPVAALANYSPMTVHASAGTYTAPTGEGFKLTGLALEVGLHRGLYKRLAAGQKG